MKGARSDVWRRGRWWVSALVAVAMLLSVFVAPSPNSVLPPWLSTSLKVALAVAYGAVTILRLVARQQARKATSVQT